MCLLNVDSLSVGYADTRKKSKILKNIHLKINNGQTTCLLGESGAGKTILAKAITALLPPNLQMLTGEISFKGKSVQAWNLRKLRGKHIFYIPQNSSAALNPTLTIKRQLTDIPEATDDTIQKVINAMGFEYPEKIINAYPFQLSEGENQRCLLAMSILLKTELLILDEPFSSLDTVLQNNLHSMLKDFFHKLSTTLLLITHNLSLIKSMADHVYIIQKGQIIENGSMADLLEAPAQPYSREIISLLKTSSQCFELN